LTKKEDSFFNNLKKDIELLKVEKGSLNDATDVNEQRENSEVISISEKNDFLKEDSIGDNRNILNDDSMNEAIDEELNVDEFLRHKNQFGEQNFDVFNDGANKSFEMRDFFGVEKMEIDGCEFNNCFRIGREFDKCDVGEYAYDNKCDIENFDDADPIEKLDDNEINNYTKEKLVLLCKELNEKVQKKGEKIRYLKLKIEDFHSRDYFNEDQEKIRELEEKVTGLKIKLRNKKNENERINAIIDEKNDTISKLEEKFEFLNNINLSKEELLASKVDEVKINCYKIENMEKLLKEKNDEIKLLKTGREGVMIEKS